MNVPGILLHQTADTQLSAFLNNPIHAVLLAGPKGIGKTYIASRLASELLRVSSLDNHAYFRTVLPEKDSISIEQIRELISFFRLKVPGATGIKRAAIIEDADTMGIEAQNALLKLLEEPPVDSVLILTTSRPQSLLTTIRSRVQLLQLAAPESKLLAQHFTAQGYDEAKVTSTLLRSGTDVAAAAKLLSGETDDTNDQVGLVKQVLGGTTYDRLLLVDGLAKQKGSATDFTHTLAAVATASLKAAASKKAPTVDRWMLILQAANSAEDALARNGNAKLVLTELMLSL